MNAYSQQAQQCRLQGDYIRAVQLYEQAIAEEPEEKSNYWHLGLVFLLQGQEAEARATWLTAMWDGNVEQIEAWNEELTEVLCQEALRQEEREAYSTSWIIRQQIQENSPTQINNLLHLIQLSIRLEQYTGEELDTLGVIQILESEPPVDVEFDLLMSALQQVLEYAPFESSSLAFASASVKYARDKAKMLKLLNILLARAIDIGYFNRKPNISAELCQLILQFAPRQPEVIHHLACFYQDSGQYEQGIEMAKFYASLVEGITDRAIANKGLVRAFMSTGGHWQEACSAFREHKKTLQLLIENPPQEITSIQSARLFNAYFYAPYFRDLPQEDRKIQNKITQIYQVNTQKQSAEFIERYASGNEKRRSQRSSHRRLKIGYLSHCFKAHSVGWLARWVFQHAERDKFELYAYMITGPNSYEPLQRWYTTKVSKTYQSANAEELAEEIYKDEIDILVELDSITLDCACAVVALKPAPIQITWLGWDASGMPAIDYFIADPYVLPESAQKYYNEKIWRLPNTYIAVDGFEVGVPTLRREDLEIEPDAIVYLSGQIGYKRNLDTVRLQMQILKQVPRSYFLIKGAASLDAVRASFVKIAEEEGFDSTRLRFLQPDPSEAIHRANLRIADIVLDTYPYNGATTTLETLWMGIPLVTRVGEQFAARNSYTMMVNAGVTEGIAWTDEEYVEWGVRLGKDETLRQQVVWKLRQSRHSSPLWNGKQFTREMEKAYREMWGKYINGQ